MLAQAQSGGQQPSSLPPSTRATAWPVPNGEPAAQQPPPAAQAQTQTHRSQPAVLAWTDVCCAVALPKGAWKEILRGVSGVSGTGAPREPGEPAERDLTAILGPSGAGAGQKSQCI